MMRVQKTIELKRGREITLGIDYIAYDDEGDWEIDSIQVFFRNKWMDLDKTRYPKEIKKEIRDRSDWEALYDYQRHIERMYPFGNKERKNRRGYSKYMGHAAYL
jgi:hypothetical protein